MDHQWKPNDFSEAVAEDLDPSNPEPRFFILLNLFPFWGISPFNFHVYGYGL